MTVRRTRPRRAWVLNFDAERELEADGAPSTPTAKVRAMHDALAKLVTGEDALVRPGDVVLGLDARLAAPLADAAAYVGDAWCPTPSARALLARAGVSAMDAPPFDVLRRVNSRAFCAALGQTLPGAVYATRAGEALAAIAQAAPCSASGDWLLKRPFGFAGRGRRKVHAGELSASDRAWLEASFVGGTGGLQVEPWVARDGDFAIHGDLDAAGAVTLGDVTRQVCDAQGAWRGTARATRDDLTDGEHEALMAAAHAAARTLAAACYFGPFGVDSYRFRATADASPQLNPRSEINARYSMGWSTGMGDRGELPRFGPPQR